MSPAADQQPGFAEWVILELLGHRRLAGWLTEQQIAGASFLRLDIQGTDGQAGITQLYSPGSVYGITPTTEEVARAVAARSLPAPVQRWELPAPEPAVQDERHCRVCLCTEADACEGGCSWTAPELCSVCAPLGECQACPRPATRRVGGLRLCDLGDDQHDLAEEEHPAQAERAETGGFALKAVVARGRKR